MAEEVKPQLRGRPEPPGRTRNRRNQYEQRVAAATKAPDLLRALTEYIRGMFIDYPADEMRQVCDHLATAAEQERRRIRGT